MARKRKPVKIMNILARSPHEHMKVHFSGAACVWAHVSRIYVPHLQPPEGPGSAVDQFLWSPLRVKEKSGSPRRV